MEAYKNEFTNGEILVTYDPKICTQSEICAKGLADVFRTTVNPWIDPSRMYWLFGEVQNNYTQPNSCLKRPLHSRTRSGYLIHGGSP
jgi:uncharacterized Fe-S cluster protein YjdI